MSPQSNLTHTRIKIFFSVFKKKCLAYCRKDRKIKCYTGKDDRCQGSSIYMTQNNLKCD